VATEDLVYALKASGATVPVEETKVVAAARRLVGHLGRGLTSRLSALTMG
jgi:hydroxymethylglutaryl-CoA lyase